MTLPTLLLDLDGTLTDPYEGIATCVLHALRRLHAPEPDAEALRDWIGPPLKASFQAWFDEHGLTVSTERAVAVYRERFATEGWRENRVYEGIPAALDELALRGHRLLVATSKPAVFARRICRHFGLDAPMHAIYGSELDGRRADKGELLAFLLRRENLSANQCMMIGDRKHDMLAARSLGVAAMGVLWGYGDRPELEASGAQHLVSEPQQLSIIIGELTGQHRTGPEN